MTKNNKIQNYQTALNRLRHVENIFDALASIFPSQNPDTLKQFSLARNNVSVVRDLTLEDFLNENFSDCVSDCATVQTVLTVKPVKPPFFAPVTLTKGDESLSFKSRSDAARFLFNKFGNQDFRSVSTYAKHISFYLKNPAFANPHFLHGYIPSRSKCGAEIPRGACFPVTLAKGNELHFFNSFSEAATFLHKKFGEQDGVFLHSYLNAVSEYCNGACRKSSRFLHGYIPSRNENN